LLGTEIVTYFVPVNLWTRLMTTWTMATAVWILVVGLVAWDTLRSPLALLEAYVVDPPGEANDSIGYWKMEAPEQYRKLTSLHTDILFPNNTILLISKFIDARRYNDISKNFYQKVVISRDSEVARARVRVARNALFAAGAPPAAAQPFACLLPVAIRTKRNRHSRGFGQRHGRGAR
jgi:hypothetical protein